VRRIRRTINWIGACGCFLVAIAFTVEHKPFDKIAILVVLGIAKSRVHPDSLAYRE